MLDFALSTVATHNRTIAESLTVAEDAGFDAVELRTFGPGSTQFACDPAMTDEPKLRALIDASGIDCCSIATGVRLDEPIFPPIIGRAFVDNERQIREGKHAIDLAAQIEVPLVRVFGFDRHGGESLKQTSKRVAWRLAMVCDHARNTGVRVVLENGGAFPSAEAIRDLIDRVDSPHLGASYNAAVGRLAGDDPVGSIELLGDSLLLARVKDAVGGNPVRLGEGELDVEGTVSALAGAGAGADIPVVFEWDAAWFPQLEPVESVASEALARLCGWAGQTDTARMTA
ncbi:MAG: TIM barrel protein [Planctomycetota bacterium]